MHDDTRARFHMMDQAIRDMGKEIQDVKKEIGNLVGNQIVQSNESQNLQEMIKNQDKRFKFMEMVIESVVPKNDWPKP